MKTSVCVFAIIASASPFFARASTTDEMEAALSLRENNLVGVSLQCNYGESRFPAILTISEPRTSRSLKFKLKNLSTSKAMSLAFESNDKIDYDTFAAYQIVDEQIVTDAYVNCERTVR